MIQLDFSHTNSHDFIRGICFMSRLSQTQMDDYFDKTNPSFATAAQLNDAIQHRINIILIGINK